MHKRTRRVSFAAPLAALVTFLTAGTASAQTAEDWCENDRNGDRERFCEVRELTLSASAGELEVDATPNGGVRVEGWDRNEIRVLAKVSSRADRAVRAQAIAAEVEIETGTRVHATGPRQDDDESWHVSYRVFVPRDYDLDLDSKNGGIDVEGVDGQIRMHTTNGGIRVENVAGDVEGRTTNGGISAHLNGQRWQGVGLDLQTTNGGIVLALPDGYNADLELATTNGGFDLEFPVTVSGKLGRRLETQVGSGGPGIRAVTTNGGVRLSRTM